MSVGMAVRMTVMMAGIAFEFGVLMDVKHADQQEHEEESAEGPHHRCVERQAFDDAVRNQMQ